MADHCIVGFCSSALYYNCWKLFIVTWKYSVGVMLFLMRIYDRWYVRDTWCCCDVWSFDMMLLILLKYCSHFCLTIMFLSSQQRRLDATVFRFRTVKVPLNLNQPTSPIQNQDKQETQLSLRDRATRACQLKSGKVLHKCRRLVFEKLWN